MLVKVGCSGDGAVTSWFPGRKAYGSEVAFPLRCSSRPMVSLQQHVGVLGFKGLQAHQMLVPLYSGGTQSIDPSVTISAF